MIYIAVDFDGTVVEHIYPEIGPDVPNAIDVLRKIQDKGYLILLNTMRSGKQLQEAIAWFEDNGINLFGINNNPNQNSWTTSTKTLANFYIDDAAIGCPLIPGIHYQRPMVDWINIEILLKEKGLTF